MDHCYERFDWQSAGPANGESGRRLADQIISMVGNLPEVKRICDLGCGNGYLAGRLGALGYEVTGVDASSTGISIAQQNYDQPAFIRDLIDSGTAERTGLREVDLVIASDIIEHLYRPADLLEAAFSILKSSRGLIVTTPYHGYWKNLSLAVAGKLDRHFGVLDDGGHIKFFSVPTLSSLIQSQGFTDLKFTFYGRAPWLWKNMICHARKAS